MGSVFSCMTLSSPHRWLTATAVLNLPILCAIMVLQLAVPIPIEAGDSPVQLYIFVNLVMVTLLAGFLAVSRNFNLRGRQAIFMTGVGFLLLTADQLLTWNIESDAEDVRVILFWCVTSVPIVDLIVRQRIPGIVKLILSLSVLTQAVAFMADYIDDGMLGATEESPWIVPVYLFASTVSMTGYQIGFFFLLMRPDLSEFGWTVRVDLPNTHPRYFDVAIIEADNAASAVKIHVGSQQGGRIRAHTPIPKGTAFLLSLRHGEVRPQ